MDKFEIMITIGMFVLVFIAGFMVAKNTSPHCNVPQISPNNDVNIEKIDMAYNIETNQTFWKYPNETEWHLLE